MADTCKTCRFWDGFESGHAYCHRYPPKPEPPRLNMAQLAYFSRTGVNDWCGEHKARATDV